MWRSWLSSPVKAQSQEESRSQGDELEAFQGAMEGILHLLNDDIAAAEGILHEGSSAFHLLGGGVALFIKGLLSFETSVLREASRVLLQAGSLATEERRLSMKRPDASATKVYPAGSEFTICLEATQILRAILGVMDTSVTETLRGFYNIRKAYLAFADLVAVTGVETAAPLTPVLTGTSKTSLTDASTQAAQTSSRTSLESDNADAFFDAEEGARLDEKLTEHGRNGSSADLTLATSTRADNEKVMEAPSDSSQLISSDLTGRVSADTMSTDGMNAIDRFVHTGSSVGFGALLLGISLIPKVFAALLRIIGFKGDRRRGLQLLWRGAEASDGYGSIGALILFEYYNAIGSICEIYTEELYPRQRLQQLLAAQRSRFPEGRLWLMYESQFAAADRDVEKAISLIDKDSGSPFKQMEALQLYVHGIYCMFMHRYEECRDSFEKGVSLNERSHALSYFVAGTASVALYRQHHGSEAAAKHAEDARRLFDLALNSAGKKTFLAKQIPFEVFIIHKIQKWKARATKSGVSFIDTIGTSPIDEMVYFWNGFKRLPSSCLAHSLANLELRSPEEKEEIDERAMRTLVRAVILRNMDKRDEAKSLLREIMLMDPVVFMRDNQDNWMCPLAHYELAISLWQELDGTVQDHDRLRECLELIQRVSTWGSFDMQPAFGTQLNMAKESIRQKMDEMGVI